MALASGTRVGIYEVTAKIGEGGMGEVYQARDTTLDRDVALKVLTEAFTADPDRLARFQREAKVLASLNHPNIGGIHGLEESGETQALVLELIEGPTLADRIAEGPIPVDEALTIAKQIADALEAAHDQGIVHRDLKPANVKVRSDGTVKVLDFGLAKAVTPEAGGASAMESVTMASSSATQVGMVIGTAAYMSPEQAKGKVVDKRTDIWAFGAVLYEMLTGARAFPGDDVSDTFASVLAREPALEALPASVSAGVRRLLTRCLEKDQQKRLRDLTEGFVQMEDVAARAAVPAVSVAPAPQLRVWQKPAVVLTGVVVAAIGGGVAVLSMAPSGRVESPELVRFTITPPTSRQLSFSGPGRDLVISPDGDVVVYKGPNTTADVSATTQLNLRPIDQLDGAPLRGGEGGANPFVSPDGEWVGFVEGNGPAASILKKVSIFGGPPVTLVDAPSPIRGASWGTDDSIVFGTYTSTLFRIPGGGGEPEALTALESGETNHAWPFILPDRNAVAFVVSRGVGLVSGELAILDLETAEVNRLGLAGVSPSYISSGHLVYAAADGSVRAVAFDIAELSVTGNPVPVVEGVMVKNSGAAAFSISDDGRLAYGLGAGGAGGQVSLVWVDRQGREEPLEGLAAGGYESFRLSPDGRRLALDFEQSRLWTYDIARGVRNPLTTESGVSDSNPVWTPDGERVVFNRGNTLFWMASDGTGEPEELLTRENASRLIPESWSPDGTRLLFSSVGGGRGITDIEMLTMDNEREAEVFIETDQMEAHPVISPDGQWVAYHSDVSGRQEVYVQRFPTLGERQQISPTGGRAPLWSPDGKELFYRSVDGREVLAVPVAGGTTLEVGLPEVLFDGAYVASVGAVRPYDLSPDGERFVMSKLGNIGEVTASSEITVVLNWHEELKARVPVP